MIYPYLLVIMLMQVSCQIRQNPTIYEISIRPWLYELSQKYNLEITKINQIPVKEYEDIKEKGVDIIWLMGVWKLGQYGVNFDKSNNDELNNFKQLLPDFQINDVIGSPYAVVEYECNPEIGSNDDIIELKKYLNNMGLKLMLDFVGNHAAIDSHYLVSQEADIDMFIKAPKNISPPYDLSTYLPNGVRYGGDQYDVWRDVAQWNYWNDKTYQYMKQSILKISEMSDAIRCDMSMLIMNNIIYQNWHSNLDSWGYQSPSQEFWVDSIKTVKAKNPNFIFLAEAYWNQERNLVSMGFDFAYDKTLLDNMVSKNLDGIRQYVQQNNQNFFKSANHFVENHDEPRAVALFNSDVVANAAALVAYTLPGAKFIFHGQLEGYRNKLDVHLRRAAKESGSDVSRNFYAQFLQILNDDVFHNGQFTYRNVGGDNDIWRLMAWTLKNNNKKVLVVINFSDQQAFGKIILDDVQEKTQGQDIIDIKELFSGQVYQRSVTQMKSDGLGVIVSQWSGQIFEY